MPQPDGTDTAVVLSAAALAAKASQGGTAKRRIAPSETTTAEPATPMILLASSIGASPSPKVDRVNRRPRNIHSLKYLSCRSRFAPDYAISAKLIGAEPLVLGKRSQQVDNIL